MGQLIYFNVYIQWIDVMQMIFAVYNNLYCICGITVLVARSIPPNHYMLSLF